MNEAEVVALMETSKSEDEWNENCLTVKRACGGDYPSFWYKAINLSGVAAKVKARWGRSDRIELPVWP